jgi:hypothetical protein
LSASDDLMKEKAWDHIEVCIKRAMEYIRKQKAAGLAADDRPMKSCLAGQFDEAFLGLGYMKPEAIIAGYMSREKHDSYWRNVRESGRDIDEASKKELEST